MAPGLVVIAVGVAILVGAFVAASMADETAATWFALLFVIVAAVVIVVGASMLLYHGANVQITTGGG